MNLLCITNICLVTIMAVLTLLPALLMPVWCHNFCFITIVSSFPGESDKEVNHILYYADVGCEMAFVIPSLLPRYRRYRSSAVTEEETDGEVDLPPRGTGLQRSGSMGSLQISSSSSSSFDSRTMLARQTSEGVGM